MFDIMRKYSPYSCVMNDGIRITLIAPIYTDIIYFLNYH